MRVRPRQIVSQHRTTICAHSSAAHQLRSTGIVRSPPLQLPLRPLPVCCKVTRRAARAGGPWLRRRGRAGAARGRYRSSSDARERSAACGGRCHHEVLACWQDPRPGDSGERTTEDEVLLHLLVGRPASMRSPFGDEVGRDHASISMVVLTKRCHFESRAETSWELPGSSGIILDLPARTTSANSPARSLCPVRSRR